MLYIDMSSILLIDAEPRYAICNVQPEGYAGFATDSAGFADSCNRSTWTYTWVRIRLKLKTKTFTVCDVTEVHILLIH